MARIILSLSGLVLADYNLSKERYTVGRLTDNDIRIDNPTVSGHHSVFINILNDSFLEDLNSTNGTYVNGAVVKKHALVDGDVVTIGQHHLLFCHGGNEEEDEFAHTMIIERQKDGAFALARAAVAVEKLQKSEAVQSAPASPVKESSRTPLVVGKVRILNGAFAGREIPLTKALTTLGRPGVEVVAITRRADSYHLIEVESNGTQGRPNLNGEDLDQQPRKLCSGDVIRVISIKMVFSLN